MLCAYSSLKDPYKCLTVMKEENEILDPGRIREIDKVE